MMMMRRSLAGRSLSSTATRDVETAIPPHPSSPHPPSGCTAIHGAFDHQVDGSWWRLGQPEHDALVVVMDLSLCLMQ